MKRPFLINGEPTWSKARVSNRSTRKSNNLNLDISMRQRRKIVYSSSLVCFLQYFFLLSAIVSIQPSTSHQESLSLRMLNETPNPTAKPITSVPTKNPTLNPTSSPTSSPTTTPTSHPTRIPTSLPTSSPTDKPTSSPTKKPSENPTNSPTFQPTFNPSNQPSDQPSDQPSNQPSLRPSNQPSLRPSAQPSKQPTSKPSDKPSSLPSSKPSVIPSWTPSMSPSMFPSIIPSHLPTSSPSDHPTSTPSYSPSSTPSVTPTTSFQPSFKPSLNPSSSPTSKPSSTPSTSPSHKPSDTPSSSPTSQPSLTPQEFTVELEIEFDDCDILDTKPRKKFEEKTQEAIQKQFLESFQDKAKIIALYVDAKKQFVPDPVVNATDASGNNVNRRKLLSSTSTSIITSALRQSSRWMKPRFLQFSEVTALIIVSDVIVELQSTIPFDNNLIEKTIGRTFNTEEKKTNYIFSLQNSGVPDFNSINKVQVKISGAVIDDDTVDPDDGKGIPFWLIVGPSIGGGAILVTVFVCYVCKKKKNVEDKSPPASTTIAETQLPVRSIVVDQSDVSTLGGFGPTQGTPGYFGEVVEKDETVAESTICFDYDKVYGGGGDVPSISTASKTNSANRSQFSGSFPGQGFSGRSARHHKASSYGNSFKGELSLFEDDNSFEKQYAEPEERIEIHAPPGKLGVVIDTPQGGVPMVHAIKDSSVLADRVRVGDRLVSVDGLDTTTMPAMKVSRLISMKSENPTRVLVFVRYHADD